MENVLDLTIIHEISKKERVCSKILEKQAKERGTNILLKFEEKIWTYSEVNTLANSIGHSFRDNLIVKKGNPVLIMMPNQPEFIFTWLGLTKIGAVEVPVNTAYKGNLLKHVINDSKARIIVIHEQFLQILSDVREELEYLDSVVIYSKKNNIEDYKRLFPNLTIHLYEKLLLGNKQNPETEIIGSDPMAIMYTSGTTGNSKGVIVSYNQAYSYAGAEFYTYWDETDCYHLSLPLFHIGGQWAGFYCALIKGASVALFPKFTATQFWEQVNEYACTTTMLLGAMASFLNSQPERPDDKENCLKVVSMVPLISQRAKFEERFRLKTATGYGSTEVSAPILTGPEHLEGITATNFIGKARPDFEIQLLDENDQPVKIGEVGECCVRPKLPWTVMTGYLNLPEKTLETWRNLWLHTGDAMYMDEEGNYYFVDRVKDAIRRRGENISSAEVETEVLSHPDVVETAAVAVPSEHTEDEIKIVISLKEGSKLTPFELVDYLDERMPYFMVPRYVEIVEELPKTPTNKIRKAVLREEGITENTIDTKQVP